MELQPARHSLLTAVVGTRLLPAPVAGILQSQLGRTEAVSHSLLIGGAGPIKGNAPAPPPPAPLLERLSQTDIATCTCTGTCQMTYKQTYMLAGVIKPGTKTRRCCPIQRLLSLSRTRLLNVVEGDTTTPYTIIDQCDVTAPIMVDFTPAVRRLMDRLHRCASI